ncbi:TonB-dependent receptor domain-containing protein [Bacteroidota bacterium]
MKSVILILIAYSNILFAQSGLLTGIVLDSETNQPLAAANIFINEIQLNTTSNLSGNFLINNIQADYYTLTISHVGYKTETTKIIVMKNQTTNLEIKLSVSPISMGEVTVSSTKSDKLTRDVSLPMEVVSAKKIEQSSYISTSDALKTQTGVALARDGIWGTHVSIRGLSRHNIVTLVDGNRLETSTNLAAGLSMIDINNIERIEVIKGGVSSLYGSGATGGVINIQTKGGMYNDTFCLSGSILSSYNSVNEGALGNISLNAGSNNWFVKFIGTLRSAGDTQTPEGILENSQFRDKGISALFGFIPFDDHELRIDFQEFKARDVGIPGGKSFPSTASATYPVEDRLMYSAEYKINNISRALVNASVKYFHQFIKREVIIIPNPNVTVTPGADHTIDGIQFQTNWLLGKNHWVSAGIDIWQREYKGHRETSIASLNRIIGDLPIPNSTYSSIGIYAQDEIRLIENKLNLTIGGRFDQVNINSDGAENPSYIITNGTRNDSPLGNPQASFAAADTDNISWSANIGMIYSLLKDVDLTLNVARTFRSPNLEERFQYIDLGGNIYLGNPELDPEKGYFFDAGIRLWNPAYTFRGNLFLNSFNDLVIDKEEIIDSLFIKSNVGEARLYGFDLSLEYNVYKNIVLYSSLAYVRGEDKDNDLDLPEIPPLNGRFGIKTRLVDFLNIDFTASIFAGQDKVAQGEQTTPGYATFDLFINTIQIDLSPAKLEFFGGIENLLDKAYSNHLATNRGLIKLEPGRNFFLKVKMSW